MLQLDPRKRPDAKEILENPWFKVTDNNPVSLEKRNITFLNKYTKYSKFKKIV